jgi:hypothetical protein
MPHAKAFVYLVIIALAPGVLALQLAIRRAPSFDGAKRVLLPLAFTIYGYLPAVVITAGLAPQSAATALAAFAFFLMFSAGANVILHGAIAHARAAERSEQDTVRGTSPNTSLERTREG